MHLIAPEFAKRFWFPLLLVLGHAALVAIMWASIALNRDPESGMFWIAFVYVDYPISFCLNLLPEIFERSNTLLALFFVVVGTIQWGIAGLIVQQAVRWLRTIKRGRV